MDYVEIIRLRAAAGTSRDEVLRVVQETLGADAPGLTDGRVYRNTRVDCDLAVHLHYQMDGEHGPRDGLGTRLAAALEDYGLVDRALWIHTTSNAEEREAPQ